VLIKNIFFVCTTVNNAVGELWRLFDNRNLTQSTTWRIRGKRAAIWIKFSASPTNKNYTPQHAGKKICLQSHDKIVHATTFGRTLPKSFRILNIRKGLLAKNAHRPLIGQKGREKVAAICRKQTQWAGWVDGIQWLFVGVPVLVLVVLLLHSDIYKLVWHKSCGNGSRCVFRGSRDSLGPFSVKFYYPRRERSTVRQKKRSRIYVAQDCE